ncbi:hypothetical protein [Streptomyces violaceusniger]|uniref:Uncharacterized protein n=1 Tax=Streptomyces violaceusniger (strain Tu 4113) TaxID=653045 RepID=G2P7B1_STRV4|nr:hypothetical protein [Streptomyces violaceusniger]AEM87071.1 hypothetical protein Strvi_7736 [Streptomyces violaceusniger Tu 4113]
MSGILIDEWTSRTASMLQAALRMTNDRFAEHLGVSVRTVSRWNVQPDLVLKKETQEILETAYERAPEKARARFALNFPPPVEPPPPPASVPNVVVELAVLQTRMEQLQTQLDQLAAAQREMTLLRVRMESLSRLAEVTGGAS